MAELSNWELEAIISVLERLADGENPLMIDDEIQECIESCKQALGED